MSKYFVNFLPAQHYSIKENQIISTEELRLFENKVAHYFKKKVAYFTINGRQGMSILFENLNLNKNDEIYVTTTFNYPNVSSCVTCTIFNFCKPSRVFSKSTKAIFIIHEFGVFHPETISLIEFGKQNNIPVIEDCAHTIQSFNDEKKQTGSLADYTIVSLPKIFAVTTGGFLVSNKKLNKIPIANSNTSMLLDAYIANNEWSKLDENLMQRKAFFNLYSSKISKANFEPLIKSSENIFPWFFPIISDRNPVEVIEKLKNNDIEASLWYGTNIIVLPLHQYLNNAIIEQVIYQLNLI